MTSESSPGKGFMLTEVIVSMAIVAILLVGTAVTLHSFREFSKCQWIRQQCIAAAQAQLDSLTATRRALPEAEANRLWPRVTLTTRFSEGQGQWQGLQRLQVTALGQSDGRQIMIRLSRYVSPFAEHSQELITEQKE